MLQQGLDDGEGGDPDPAFQLLFLRILQIPTFFSYRYPVSRAQFWQILLPRNIQIPHYLSVISRIQIIPFQTLKLQLLNDHVKVA